MRILVKFPSRERPLKFSSTLKGYHELADDPSEIHYMVTADTDDRTMNTPAIHNFLATIPRASIHYGSSISKISAVNRDIHYAPAYDILVLASDDMICKVKGWDTILRMEMTTHFPDTDGVLFHWDGDPATWKHNDFKHLCTMCIHGRKYQESRGYIYHPDYASLFCDNEYTEVAQQLQKCYFSEQVLFRHEHYTNTPGIVADPLMKRTQRFYAQDEKVYNKRKMINFGI